MDLANNFFVLFTNMKVYLYNCSMADAFFFDLC